MNTPAYFRVGVGLLVVEAQGLVLAGERSDIAGAWQAPQGGLEEGEEPLDAARRELSEEVGIQWSAVSVLEEHPEWLAYELPPEARSRKTGRGQVQKWFLVRHHGPDDNIDVRGDAAGEFNRWRWMAMPDLIERAWIVRQPIYRRLAEDWSLL